MGRLRIDDLSLDIYDPSGYDGTVDRTINWPRIRSVEFTQKVDDSKDSATLKVYNTTSGPITDEIPLHSRVDINLQASDQATDATFFSAYPYSIRETVDEDGNQIATLECHHFVWGRLGDTQVANIFRDKEVNTVLVDILDDATPNLNVNGDVVTDTITVGWNYENAHDAVQEVAAIAGIQLAAFGEGLFVFDRSGAAAESFTLTNDDILYTQSGGKSLSIDDMGLKNEVVVVGGEADRVDASQTTQSSTVNVNETSGSDTYEVTTASTSKTEISRVDVYTELAGDGSGGDSTDNLKCRIQKTDGAGNAIALTDSTKDLSRAVLQPADITDGGYSEFVVNAEGVPDTIAIIMESDGPDGQNVGVDSNDNLTFKTYYPFKLVAQASDVASQDEYFTVAARENSDVTDLDIARDIASAELKRNKVPEKYLRIDAGSPRAHKLDPADVVRVSDDDFGITNQQYFCRRVDSTIEGPLMRTTLQLQNLASIGE